MGLDIVLGLVVLAASVRGWLRGFVIQTIRLVGLVGAIYSAAPVRDLVRPYAASHFQSIRPELLDRILWWSSGVAVYIVSVGLATLVLKMQRRRPFGEVEPNRTDQFAGFLLGGIKGLVVAAFVVSGLQTYVVPRVKGVDWAEEQATTSYAIKWNAEHHPARKVWTSVPVQHLVSEVKRMGLPTPPSGESEPAPIQEQEPVQAAHVDGPPRLELERRKTWDVEPESPDFTQQFDRIFDQVTPRSSTSK